MAIADKVTDEPIYDLEFQRKLLYTLSNNYEFYANHGVNLNPSYFETQQLQVIFKLIMDYLALYQHEIAPSDLLTSISEFCMRKAIGKEANKALIVEAKTICRLNIKDTRPVEDATLSFIRRMELKKALVAAVDDLLSGSNIDYQVILSRIDKAVSVGDTLEVGKTYDDLLNLPELYRKKYDPQKMVRTGFPSFDAALDGGMPAGGITVILAPPKTGKTTMGCNIGVNNLLLGKTVFHYSLEISEEDILAKYACKMANMSYHEIRDITVDEFRKRIERFTALKPNLFVKFYPEQTASVLHIRAHISKMRALTGKSPDLIIIDYDDCLLPSTGRKGNGEDQYYASGQIYTDLIGLANSFDVPILTFAQPGRQAWNYYEKEGAPITSDMLAHSAMKAMRCHSISSINFKKGQNKGILYLDINRRGMGDKKIPIVKDLDKAYFGEAQDYAEE